MLAPRKVLWSTPSIIINTAMEWIGGAPSLSSEDTICDLGCGDGRVILQWAQLYTKQIQQNEQKQEQHDEQQFASFIGIDIEFHRIQCAQEAIQQAKDKKSIDSRIQITFHCINALHLIDFLFPTNNSSNNNNHPNTTTGRRMITIIFLYLTPRGLRQIVPIIDQIVQHQHTTTCSSTATTTTNTTSRRSAGGGGIRVLSYMAPLPIPQKPIRQEYIQIPSYHQTVDVAWPLYLYQIQ